MNAFIDIETDAKNKITVIGINIPGKGVFQLVRPNITTSKLFEILFGVKQIFTFNGTSFDIPIIKKETGLDLSKMFRHIDVLVECRNRGIKGGQKKIENFLDIQRETFGMDGSDAVRLWNQYKSGNKKALELLLKYNREDVVNLEKIVRKIGLI
ncbi:MAG: ribonuclease H-like domain-containing protein [bacterium]|nr:ribonuclease H-like domain-containing protein [bacterium]